MTQLTRRSIPRRFVSTKYTANITVHVFTRMAYAHDQGHDASKRGLTGSYHQRTYGTVRDDFSHSASPKRDTKVLVHEVKPTDTLQGIALKYDVTVSL